MDDLDLYEVLGVAQEATDAEIKKNYHKLVEDFHPDKHSDSGDKFKDISFAYEVLSDPEKRKIYDKFGKKGLQEAAGINDDEELLSQWFPFVSMTDSHIREDCGKAAEIVIKLEVSLEEIYNGNVSKSVEYKRTSFCQRCNGYGGPKEAQEKCSTCNGMGRTSGYVFMGLTPVETLCSSCEGSGNTIPEGMRCVSCQGKGLTEENVKREIIVEKGAPNMLKIPFISEGNQGLQNRRGDLIVVLIQAEHPLFQRRNNDLIMRNIHINLTQALCGVVHCFKHLDGRDIYFSTKPGEVVRHGEIKAIPGEGMPLRNNPFDRGDLLVPFVVDFPDNGFASPDQLEKLETLLPPRSPFTMPADAEEVQLVEFQPRDKNDFYFARGGLDDDKDFEGSPHFERVQCQTG